MFIDPFFYSFTYLFVTNCIFSSYLHSYMLHLSLLLPEHTLSSFHSFVLKHYSIPIIYTGALCILLFYSTVYLQDFIQSDIYFYFASHLFLPSSDILCYCGNSKIVMQIYIRYSVATAIHHIWSMSSTHQKPIWFLRPALLDTETRTEELLELSC